VVALAALAAGIAFDLSLKPRQASTTLPAGCVKPPNGFLIIASNTGYNDSVAHGVPSKPWPVINVTQGQMVSINVCNTDSFAHGFQIIHYHDGQIYAVGPGQVTHVQFVANEAGTFQIYCAIPCEVHLYMQSGQLVVAPS